MEFGIATTTATVSNFGTITGALDGVNTQNTTTLTNSGTITGTARSGVRVGSNASIDNSGLITGLTGIVFRDAGAGFGAPTNGSVFNSGTITGTGGTAINFAANAGAGPFSLTIAPTSVINGNVLGTGADIFQLGSTGSGAFNVNNIGTAQQYRGFATFNKIGTSTWTLTGTNAAALPWTISAGTLAVDGSIGNSSMTVNAGGTLGGNGTVGNTTINGGTLAPGSASGSAFGPLTVQGTLSLTAASTYMIQVTPANADRTNVTGAATLGGATVNLIFAAGAYVSKQYTIVNATGGVTGTFSSLVNTNLPSNVSASLSYDAHDAFLNLTLSFVPPSAPNFGGGLNGNQQNVANALTNFFNTTGGIPMTFAALTPAGLTQAAGEAGDRFAADHLRRDEPVHGPDDRPVRRRTRRWPGGAGATPFAETGECLYRSRQAAFEARARCLCRDLSQGASAGRQLHAALERVGARAYGGRRPPTAMRCWDRTTRPAASPALRSAPTTASRRLRWPALRWPAAAPVFRVATDLAAAAPTCSRPAPIVRHTVGPAYISAALAYGWQDVTTDRTVTIAGVDRLRAQFNANAFSGRVEGGYRFVTPWMRRRLHALCRGAVHHLRSAGLCRAGACRAPTPLR